MSVCEPAYDRCKPKNGGLIPPEVRRLRHIEEESTRLRELVMELTLNNEIPSGVLRRANRRLLEVRSSVSRTSALGAHRPIPVNRRAAGPCALSSHRDGAACIHHSSRGTRRYLRRSRRSARTPP